MTVTFQQYLQSAFIKGLPATDEVVEFVLPLFEEVASFHQNAQVGSFEKPDTLFLTIGRLDIDENFTHSPSSHLSDIEKMMEQQQIKGYAVRERILLDEDVSNGRSVAVSIEVQTNPKEPVTAPVYLPGYQCYEMKLEHHDAQTDIFCLGLILGSIVMGLNLYNTDDLHRFATYRNQPAGINNRIHPTVCALITEMTELDRMQRSRDLQEIIQRLKHYRDYDPQKEADLSKLAFFEIKKPADRKTFILSKLRNRLFDTSRRNRLLYYKPNSRFVNLTVSSVPMVLHYQSINPQLLFVWNKEIAQHIKNGKDILLNRYLRFEDHLYLNSQLDSIRQQSEKDKKEYGFSQLKLVVAFLHWHNLKENAGERIQSPLLLVSIKNLVKNKSLKEEKFTLETSDAPAMVNPVLANYLKDLYGIELPESIDFGKESMEDFFGLVKSKIDAARQGVKLNYIDKPRVRVIHSIARQTINNYRKKLKIKGTAFNPIEYSYSEDNYNPLGLALFKQKIEPKQTALEFLVSDKPASESKHHFTNTDNGVIKTSFHLTDGDSNPYSWDFDVCNAVLGNFNYKKMSLVRDYASVTEDNIEHPVFTELFSNEPKEKKEITIENNPAEWYHVITADPTQSKAVLHSRTGSSYIIQGPPGTGKSQTITNLIADFLAQGKSVLFVCEKRAALDVVYHRLQQNRLAELCCYIHDSQGDKKEFFKDLKTVYDDFIKNKMDVAAIASQRNDILSQLLQNISVLQAYHDEQKKVSHEAGISTRQLIETVIQLKNFILKKEAGGSEIIPHYRHWLQGGEAVQKLSKALEESGAEPQLAAHPFSNLANELIEAENPFTLLDRLIIHAYASLQHIADIIKQNGIPKHHAEALQNIKNLVEDSVVLESLAQSKNLQLVESSNKESKEFEEKYEQYKQAKSQYQQALQSNSKWLNKWERNEVESALQLALKHEDSFFSFLNGRWRRLKKGLHEAYDFSAHAVKPSYSFVLQQLQEEYKREEELKQQKEKLHRQYGEENIDAVHSKVEALRSKQGDEEIDYLLQHPHSNELVLQLSRLNNTLYQLEQQLKQCLYQYEAKTIHQLNDELATLKSNADVLKDLLPSLRLFARAPEALQQYIRKVAVTPSQAEAAMADNTLQALLHQHPSFACVKERTLKEAVRNIEKNYKELLNVNSDYIRAQRRQQFINHYELSNTSAAVLSPEDKLLKKEYTDGRRILEHEMNKTMRFKSIREMASNESGKVLKDIKPVWLMSPLSVSDSLPLNTHSFDVVIFDEASQITLEEGVPSLFRAPQTIIVGDDKQMPPSNFFSTRAEDPEDLETIDGEHEDEILTADADSLLVQGSRKLNSTMLSWHYRSRYESLISYSNHAFYDAGLLTIPDKTIHHKDKPLTVVKHPEEGSENASLLLNGSFSFHYLQDSVYENRTNFSEARYIANMLKELLLRDVSETIGIVAFSQEQQGVIEEAIDALAVEDKVFEDALEKAYNRKEEGQFTGLFVKNLENVQGDERDIMIMSVCYGHDSNRKMLMNFGPINRKGGEKRLNVIFSRAKKHMAVVSSIRHYHITNDYNDGANYFKKFLHYAEAVSTGNAGLSRTILDSLMHHKQQLKKTANELTAVAVEIKKALQREGYVVDEQIGQSSFKCTLGVKRETNDAQYALGILVDDDSHYNNNDIAEQYYQRPAILQAFGWKVYNVFAKDWLEDSQRVMNTLRKELIEEIIDTDDEENETEVKPSSATESDDAFTTFQSAEEDKFWQILREGQQLQVRFGKLGTKGQVMIKSFADNNEAESIEKKWIEEQVALGYRKKH